MTTPKSTSHFKPSSSDFQFREYPFYWLMRLSNRYSQTMESQLKLMGMNLTNWRICLILRNYGSISMTEVATHAVGRLPTITKSVYRMQEQDLVKITKNDQDARITMVSITDHGLETVEQLIKNTSKTIDRAFGDLSEEELSTMNQLLKKVFENIS